VTVRTIRYGAHPDSEMDVHRPSVAASGVTTVLVHGGFWRDQYRRDLMDPLIPSLLADGHIVVNLEYRRIGGAGAWPALLTDVAAGVDALIDVEGVDPGRVVTIGHSAGGHLAVWLAGRHRIPAGSVGCDPVIRPCHAVSQAGVLVFDEARASNLGRGAVDELLGELTDERLAAADPARLLPLGVPVTLVHGERDDTVPLAQSELWVTRATAAGDQATLITRDGDHFSVLIATHPLWLDVIDAVRGAC
jgi:acetyl esterase/lipase